MAYEDLIKRLQAQQPKGATAPSVAPSSQAGVTSISYSKAPDVDPAKLRGAADLAKQYGNINYDEDAIYDVFKGAVDSQYDAKQAGYDRSASDYYNRLGYTQDMMEKTMYDDSIRSGASAGMQNASRLSTMLGLSQQTTADATKLTQEQRALVDERTAAEMQAKLDAMNTAQERKAFLAQLDAQLHASDTQYAIGKMGAESQVSAANTAASAQGRTADQAYRAALDNARYNLAGAQYTADQNLAGQNFATLGSASSYGYSADQNLAGSKYNADSNVKSANISAGATRDAAAAQAAAQRSAAQISAAAQVRAAETSADSYNYQAELGYDAQVLGYEAEKGRQLVATMGQVVGSALNNNISIKEVDNMVSTWLDAQDEK